MLRLFFVGACHRPAPMKLACHGWQAFRPLPPGGCAKRINRRHTPRAQPGIDASAPLACRKCKSAKTPALPAPPFVQAAFFYPPGPGRASAGAVLFPGPGMPCRQHPPLQILPGHGLAAVTRLFKNLLCILHKNAADHRHIFRLFVVVPLHLKPKELLCHLNNFQGIGIQ
jgi:hypothetical protein